MNGKYGNSLTLFPPLLWHIECDLYRKMNYDRGKVVTLLLEEIGVAKKRRKKGQIKFFSPLICEKKFWEKIAKNESFDLHVRES